MLLGRFPFDHFDCPDPDSEGAQASVAREQMAAAGGSWRAAPRVAPHIWLLSEPARDLLDKLLQVTRCQIALCIMQIAHKLPRCRQVCSVLDRGLSTTA
jgi:hypothetical protein